MEASSVVPEGRIAPEDAVSQVKLPLDSSGSNARTNYLRGSGQILRSNHCAEL